MTDKPKNIVDAMMAFFAVEIRNKDQGGDSPATIGSAYALWWRTPADTRAKWTGITPERTFLVSLMLNDMLSHHGSHKPLPEVLDEYEQVCAKENEPNDRPPFGKSGKSGDDECGGNHGLCHNNEGDNEGTKAPDGLKPYSVLLLYPDYATSDYGGETFYAWVEAETPEKAVEKAREDATAAQIAGNINDPCDFRHLLVLEGHHDAALSVYDPIYDPF